MSFMEKSTMVQIFAVIIIAIFLFSMFGTGNLFPEEKTKSKVVLCPTPPLRACETSAGSVVESTEETFGFSACICKRNPSPGKAGWVRVGKPSAQSLISHNHTIMQSHNPLYPAIMECP